MMRTFSHHLSRLAFGRPLVIRPSAFRPNITRLQSTSQTREDEEDVSKLIKQFGTYIPVLSDDPYAVGTEHIQPRTVPPHIERPPYARSTYNANKPAPYRGNGLIKLGTTEESKVRRAGALAAMALQYAQTLVKPGTTTEELDNKIHDFILSHGAYPSPLGYPSPEGPYPKSTCTSVNNCIVHGIPDSRELEDGDIVNIDITVYLGGFHGDTSCTFLVGQVDRQGRYLTDLSMRALAAGVSVCHPGAHFRNIGRAIHDLVRRAEEESGDRYVVSPQFTGHGIGREFHRPPWIMHTVNEEPDVMQPGHCFTIEPAIIQGTDPSGWMLPDGWTVLSESYGRSAQAEHTVLITQTGADVLTDRKTAAATFEKHKS